MFDKMTQQSLTRFKLLPQNLTSHNDTLWELNTKKEITIPGNELCTNQVLHMYDHPVLAVIFNPIHANISRPRLFEITCDEITHDGTKGGSTHQTLMKELPLPVLTVEQKVAFAIKVSLLVCEDQDYMSWAEKWLSGEDRSREAAGAAASALGGAWTTAARGAWPTAARTTAARTADADAAWTTAASEGLPNELCQNTAQPAHSAARQAH